MASSHKHVLTTTTTDESDTTRIKNFSLYHKTVELIAQGAEAKIYKDEQTIIKKRVSKSYRHDELDDRLRSERTNTETSILSRLSCTPNVTPSDDDYTITSEYIDGALLTEYIEDNPSIMEAVGDALTTVHDNDIYHGDLTTSNIIIQDNQPIFIDFGLGGYSDRVEDKAVDIYLLKKALVSKHQQVLDQAWTSFLDGYQPNNRDAVQERFHEVKQRGRYK